MQIAQAFRTFGITATTTNLLAIKISTSPSITSSSVAGHLSASVKGTLIDFNDQTLAPLTDVAKVRKLYKLGGVAEVNSKGKRRRKDGSEEGSRGDDVLEQTGIEKNSSIERKELEVAVVGLMALRGAV